MNLHFSPEGLGLQKFLTEKACCTAEKKKSIKQEFFLHQTQFILILNRVYELTMYILFARLPCNYAQGLETNQKKRQLRTEFSILIYV